jgi:hypothetical protein
MSNFWSNVGNNLLYSQWIANDNYILFRPSDNIWYVLRQGGYRFNWNTLKDRFLPNLSNSNMTIEFTLYFDRINNGGYRNIFRVTNTNNQYNNIGDRMPAVFISNGSNRIFVNWSGRNTINVGPNAIEGDFQNQNGVNVKMSWSYRNSVQNFVLYINNIKKVDENYVSVLPADNNTYLYLSDNFHNNNNTVKIKNFKIIDNSILPIANIITGNNYKIINNFNSKCNNSNRIQIQIPNVTNPNECYSICDNNPRCKSFDIKKNTNNYECNLYSTNTNIFVLDNNYNGCYDYKINSLNAKVNNTHYTLLNTQKSKCQNSGSIQQYNNILANNCALECDKNPLCKGFELTSPNNNGNYNCNLMRNVNTSTTLDNNFYGCFNYNGRKNCNNTSYNSLSQTEKDNFTKLYPHIISNFDNNWKTACNAGTTLSFDTPLTSKINGYTYIGCFNKLNSSLINEGNNRSTNQNGDQSLDKCRLIADDYRHSYFGLLNGVCYTSNSIDYSNNQNQIQYNSALCDYSKGTNDTYIAYKRDQLYVNTQTENANLTQNNFANSLESFSNMLITEEKKDIHNYNFIKYITIILIVLIIIYTTYFLYSKSIKKIIKKFK